MGKLCAAGKSWQRADGGFVSTCQCIDDGISRGAGFSGRYKENSRDYQSRVQYNGDGNYRPEVYDRG